LRASHQLVYSRLVTLFTPRPRLNVWQWADAHRFLAKGVSSKSEHGDARYVSAEAPHQRGVQESFTDPEVQMTVFIGASQVAGKTEVMNNVIGYHMDYAPRSMVVMYSTIDTAEKFSKNKLTPMVEHTPCIAKIVSEQKSRSSQSTILQKQFVGGSIYIVGSNSTSSLRGASGPVLLGDEVDDYESDIGGQGDPIDLLWKRGESYKKVVKGLFSTPTIEGSSRIWKYFEDSDQRFWFMPCVHCGRDVVFKWSNSSKLNAELDCALIEWTKGDTKSAHLICQCCAGEISDKQRLDMYYAGKWKPTQPFTGVRGFHLNWLYCPWPAHDGFDNRLHEMATEWERAKKKGENSIKVIINTGLAECFAEQYEQPPEWDALLLRLEPYETPIPAPVVYLTCFIDVQSDRLEYEVLGWAVGEESYGIKTGKLFGNPQQQDVWDQAVEILNEIHLHPCGARLKIGCALIDSGGQSDNRAFALPVYRFVKRRQGQHVFASKGSSVIGSPLVVGHLQKNGIMLQSVGTDVCKSAVYERLKLQLPGPGYCHFPQDAGYDEEYFKQLCAERVVINKSKRAWVKTRARNEGLDMRAGNLAAFEIRRPNLEAIQANLMKGAATEKALKESVVPVVKPETFPKPVVKPVNPFRRRASFSNWK
jgi:phage terminase large subunit GpA-like protein